MIASPIEHPSVIEPLSQLAERGMATHWLPVDSTGAVIETGFAEALHEGVRLVTVMLANNETGVIQPIAKLTNLLAGQATLSLRCGSGSRPHARFVSRSGGVGLELEHP